MSNQTKTLLTRKIGHVPFRSVVGANDKGRYIATAKMNGQEFIGEGDSARTASLALKRVVDKAALEDKIKQATR